MSKRFDCVVAKLQAQEELLAEYKTRKAAFSSYADFIRATSAEDPRVQAFKKRVAEARRESA
jgi:hypothetical protein